MSNTVPQDAPDFVAGVPLPRLPVRDDSGRPIELLAALEGQPSLLLCLPRPRSPACRQAARRLAALEIAVPRLVRAVLLPETSRGEEVVGLAELGLKTLVAVRPGALPASDSTLAYALSDTAGRIAKTASLRPGQVGQLAALARAALAPAATEAGPLARTAPVLIVPDVLAPDSCRRLVEYFDRSGGQPSGVLDLSGPEAVWRPDPAVKRRRDLALEDPRLVHEVEQAVARRVLPEILKCFHYPVTHHERFKLVCYEQGSGYFRPHRDNETSDTLYRRFAMTINLNTGDYDGGALQFPEFGTRTYRPPLGGAIVFSCSLLHEATDVTRGKRYAVLGFFYNPDDGLGGSPAP